ncbi:MAG: hypothetical protein QXK37_01750 [Candidatus Woesearchaeota archaeon]
MKMLKLKNAFVGMWSDVFKGFFFGLIAGIILILLIVYKVIPIGIEICRCNTP